MGGNSGSPIQARFEVNVMAVILIILALIAVIAAVFFISRAITNFLKSPAHLEKLKKRPTSQKDINEISSTCALTKNERDVLWKLAKVPGIPNILFLVKDTNMLEETLKAKYTDFCAAQDEESKAGLFSLRKKLLKHFRQVIIVKNSKAIDPDTVFTYTVTKGFHHKLILKENNHNGLIFELPDSLKNSDDRPKELNKVNLVFEATDGTPYSFETRVIRYQKNNHDNDQVIFSHSDSIQPLQKRESERAELSVPCKFRSVKTVENPKNKKESIHYEPSEKEYDGILEDISAGGCRIITKLPIKAGQKIFIDGPLNGKQNDTAIGEILRTTKRSDEMFILHIHFIIIEIQVVNRIQAMVTKYDL